MEQDYELLAQSRANYYTAGSPIQFVRVELLKGSVTGEIVVCLTFKNIRPQPLAGLVIRFKCKSPAGAVLCEDEFYYEELHAAQGDLFGADDAVYVSNEPIGSVEVELDRAFLQDGSAVELGGFKRVRLPAPKLLPAALSQRLEQSTGKTGLTVVPQIIDNGWYCACGAFHSNEEDSVYCSECGCDRILLQNTLTNLLREAAPRAAAPAPAPTVAVSEPTRSVPMTDKERFEAEYRRKKEMAPPPIPEEEDEEVLVGGEQPLDDSALYRPVRGYRPEPDEPDEYDVRDYDGMDEDEEEDADADMKVVERQRRAGRYAEGSPDTMDDAMAEKIIRYAPPITAVLCAIVIAIGVIVHFLG